MGETLIAREGLPKPETCRAVVRGLADVLPRPFAERFEGVAGPRNVLAHDSARVDRLAGFLDRLDDFRAFARHVAARLAAPGGAR